MTEHLDAIRAAVADGATADQKAHGAAACRAILAALGAEPGKPITLPGAPRPHPLATIDPAQALDLLIAKLTAALPKDDATPVAPSAQPTPRALRLAFVSPPPRRPGAGVRPQPARAKRQP